MIERQEKQSNSVNNDNNNKLYYIKIKQNQTAPNIKYVQELWLIETRVILRYDQYQSH